MSNTTTFSQEKWKRTGALLVIGFLILILLLDWQGSRKVYEAPFLLACLNTLFLGFIPLVVAHLCAKSYQSTGAVGFMIAGCGMVFFSVSSLYAGWILPFAGTPNPTVTIHNTGILFAGICQLAGTHFFLQYILGTPKAAQRIHGYKLIYTGIGGLMTVLAILATTGYLPTFFDPVNGPSALRQWVVSIAIMLFAVTGFIFLEIYALVKSEFAYWYCLALWLIAIGLGAIYLQNSVGSLLGWSGRSAQFLGGLFFLIAFLQARWEWVKKGQLSTVRSGWTLWPYLEQKVNERTSALTQINADLQKEIEQHRIVQQELRQSQERYHNFIDQSFEAISRTEMEQPIDTSLAVETQIDLIYDNAYLAECNQSMAELYGFPSPAEFTNKRLVHAHGGRNHPINRAALRRLIEQGYRSMNDETFEFTIDGRMVWLRSNTIGTVENGRLVRLWKTTIDITEQKRAERITQARLRLNEFAVGNSGEKLMQRTLDEICQLSDSPMGVLNYLEADESTVSLQIRSSQAVEAAGAIQQLAAFDPENPAAIWANCVRQRQPLVYNEYAGPTQPDETSGQPGLLTRVMMLPVLRSHQVMAVIVVANRAMNYTHYDVEEAWQLADLTWEIIEHRRAEERIQKSLQEKETLLREIYHRTKNNMSVIIALLGLQAESSTDQRLKDSFAEAQHRIRSMALVHQKLYDAHDLSRINLKEYILDLVPLMVESYRISPARVAVETDMEDVYVLIDTAIPLGLILSELLSNALKYAFPDNREGEIRVQLHRTFTGDIHLCVADNGVGVASGYDFRREGHLGTQNIFMLGEGQLHGRVTFDTCQGVACYLQFRDSYYHKRV